LEGLSRTILAGSLTTDQEADVLLHVYFQALLRWGLWEEVVSDHGGQFRDNDWIRVNKRHREETARSQTVTALPWTGIG
jgi:hypothetical protein